MAIINIKHNCLYFHLTIASISSFSVFCFNPLPFNVLSKNREDNFNQHQQQTQSPEFLRPSRQGYFVRIGRGGQFLPIDKTTTKFGDDCEIDDVVGKSGHVTSNPFPYFDRSTRAFMNRFIRIGRSIKNPVTNRLCSSDEKRSSGFVRIGKSNRRERLTDINKRGAGFVRIGKSSAWNGLGIGDKVRRSPGGFVRIGKSAETQDLSVHYDSKRSPGFVRIGKSTIDPKRSPGFVRIGKSPGFVRIGKSPGFVRIGKSPGFVRIGKSPGFVRIGKSSGFVRIGKSPGFVRIGKSPGFVRIGRSSGFVRIGKSPGFVRIGKSTNGVESNKRAPGFVRIGKSSGFVRIGKSSDNVSGKFHELQNIKRSFKSQIPDEEAAHKRQSSFVRIGKSPGFVRIGKTINNLMSKKASGFVRIGRSANELLNKLSRSTRSTSFKDGFDKNTINLQDIPAIKRSPGFVRIGKSFHFDDNNGMLPLNLDNNLKEYLENKEKAQTENPKINTPKSNNEKITSAGTLGGADSSVLHTHDSSDDTVNKQNPHDITRRSATFVRIGKIPSTAFVSYGKDVGRLFDIPSARRALYRRRSRNGGSNFVRIG